VTITRVMLTLVGVAAFCLLSLLTPDVALIGGERVNVPFAGLGSFLGFIVVGPGVLIGLRAYLQVYVEHWRRLDPIRRRLQAPSAPAVAPLQNPLLRTFAGFVLYLLLPVTMVAFTWKAAVLPAWGSGLLCATVGVAAGHLSLLRRWPWSARGAVAYGESRCGKTFLAVDLACHIAAGMRWRAMDVEQGVVVYVAAESPKSVERRAKAWMLHHGIERPPLVVVRSTVDLLTHDTEAVIALLARIAREHERVALVVIDTLARAMVGGRCRGAGGRASGRAA
jgi:hypothetical protein